MNNDTTLPRVLINTVPKSGTHLVLQMILGIPGMKITPSWIFTEADFEKLQIGTVGPGHLGYNIDTKEKLLAKNIKVIFVSRDPRDIAVSLVHFVMLNKWGHPLNPYLKQLNTHEERLLAIIKGVDLSQEEQRLYNIKSIPSIKEFTESRFNWIDESSICAVTFEELVKSEPSQNQAMLKIINFLWEDLSSLNLTKMDILAKMKQNIRQETSGTFRKGAIGDWRNEFTADCKQAFKSVAGDLLIRLGYEKDYNR